MVAPQIHIQILAAELHYSFLLMYAKVSYVFYVYVSVEYHVSYFMLLLMCVYNIATNSVTNFTLCWIIAACSYIDSVQEAMNIFISLSCDSIVYVFICSICVLYTCCACVVFIDAVANYYNIILNVITC